MAPDAKNIFIAATGQNAGKTMVSLGLINAFSDQAGGLAFFKPVGQRYVEIARGEPPVLLPFDEDAVLMDQVCELSCRLEDMSPVTVGRGFTRDYILGRHTPDLAGRIIQAYGRVRAGADIVVIEGTGHAGVGSVIGLSNARVAQMLGAPVLLVAPGGIGRPIDEIALNLEFFRCKGVRVLGVILNRVVPEKAEYIREVTGKGLQRMGVPLMGVVPNEPVLAGPTIGQVLEETGGELLHGSEALGNHVERIVVGAMTPHQFLDYCGPNVLVITGGDREDLILAAMSCSRHGAAGRNSVSGLVLTGGIRPHGSILDLLCGTDIPVIVVQSDSYETASSIHDLTAKILPSDTAKIATVRRLVRQCADVDGIYASM